MIIKRNYELEINAEELKAIGRVERNGGIADMVLDMVLGKKSDTVDEYEDESEDDEKNDNKRS